MSVVHGHGRGKRLDTCLVLKPRASGVVSLQHVSMAQYAGCARAWMRQAPWYVPCASSGCVGCREFTTCVNVSLSLLCTGMDEACTSVRALCFSRIHPVSRVCSMCQCFFKSVVHGQGRGKRLGTCLVLELRASSVVSL